MRLADAPSPGWFPDPENRSRLRWWDGTDWSEVRRAPPTEAELDRTDHLEPHDALPGGPQVQMPTTPAGLSRQDSAQLIAEVRQAARAEIDRAANVFTERAQSAVRGITPLITDYTSTLLKWVRRAVIIAIVLLVAYFVFQVVVQASFFEWLGDRIDNWTDDDSLGVTPGVRPEV